MGIKDKFTGWLGGFLSAGVPPPVATPKEEAIATGMAGREFDFDAGINNNYQPRSGHGEVKFADLIYAANNYTLLKIVIATRLDQISAQRWKLTGPKLAVKRVGEILKKPDRRSDFDTFLRALVYEALVTDAVTIMPRKNKLGGIYSLDLIDGSTIEPKLGEDGRIDLSPDGIAYQQILGGLPVYNFSFGEILYRPVNWRVGSKYGRSPVEQVLMACRTGMARDEEIYSRMTRGNMPDKFVVAPEGTSKQLMEAIQEKIDGYFVNFENKAKAKVVPHGTGIIDIERGEIKSELDDQITRTICFAFSISPQQLIQMQNRATAESSSKQALAEGLLPLMRWIERLWNEIIHDYIGYPEVNFVWEEVETLSALEKAQINEIEIRSGVRTVNEVREKLGLKPIEEDEANDDESDPQEAAKGRPLGELSRAKKVQAAAPQNRVAAAVAAALASGIIGQITNLFGGVEADVLRQVGLADLPANATPEQAAIAAKNIAEGLYLAGFTGLADRMRGLMESVAVNAIEATAKRYGDDIQGSVAVANMRAAEYARNRSAELVGMRRNADGNLAPNPAPNMAITDTTRKMIQGEVERAILEGYGHKQIADRLKSSGVFGESRAKTIAITELAQAYINGNNGYYETASVKFKQWAIASDESGVCGVCTDNSHDGIIPWNKPFSGGQMHPTAHPRCHCDIIPYTKMPNK